MLSESACAYPLLGNFHKPIVCQWCKHLLLNVWRGGIPLLGKGTKGWYLSPIKNVFWNNGCQFCQKCSMVLVLKFEESFL